MDQSGIVSRRHPRGGGLIAAAVVALLYQPPARAAWIWVEGEAPARAEVRRHPWWYDQVKKDQLSGGDFISHWDGGKSGLVEYEFRAPRAGAYAFWVRANPVGTRLSYRLNGGDWTPIDLEKDLQGNTNIAADGKIDVRFIAWARAGTVRLEAGANAIRFRMDSPNNHHGAIDCFAFADEPFRPSGTQKPGQVADLARQAGEDAGWVPFAPPEDPFRPASGIDLRHLNEKEAGAGGFIGVMGSEFVHQATGAPVRFWAVNGLPGSDPRELRRAARVLAKRGVNLVRLHGGYYSDAGDLDMAKVRQASRAVAALKAEGIYAHLSIYFPLWLRPKPGTPWLEEYDGQKHPFAALYFNKEFQERYRGWWKAVLTTPDETTGRRLIDEPAVMGAEIINEDSYFFWTFNPGVVPDAQLRIVEGQFGAWLKAKYGSIDAAIRAWGGAKVARDDPNAGRVGFRPHWNIANERTPRDRDTVRFLAESQGAFYRETYQFLRGLGFKGTITASNWATADPRVLGPLEKYTYTVGDFIDRHGYFGCRNEGDNSGWSIRDGHSFLDRSALKFDPEEPGKRKAFVNPAMDPAYDGKPSMISETTFNRPNRYRSEAPLYFAAYGALQGSDAIVHFAFDTASWSVQPGYFMQPWTLMTPAMMGQFPAAALIYREGLVEPGALLVDLDLGLDHLYNLEGTPLPQDAAFDELRARDVPRGAAPRPGEVIDPLVHFAGRANVSFSARGKPGRVADLSRLIDRERRSVSSSTGQLRLDYGSGVLAIDAPAAQGISGGLRAAGRVELTDLSVASGLELGHVVAVALDGLPLSASRKVLLQVMSEEKATGFRVEPNGGELSRIRNIGRDPWLVRRIEGTVRFKRPDAARLKVTALDGNGDPVAEAGTAGAIALRPETLYYLIQP